MAKTIEITNGSGTASIINGSYSVSSSVNGYDNTSINPSSVTIDEQTNTYNFTISANGTLTLHVSDDGTAQGNPIVGATFSRTSFNGTEYGPIITTDSNGDAVFNNVPYDANNAPIVYYKQLSSDGDHEFSPSVQSTTLTSQTQTVEIQNLVGATRTINLTDANYANLPIDDGILTLSES